MKKMVLTVMVLAMGTFAMAQKTPMTPEKKAEMLKQKETKAQEHLAEMQKELQLNATQMDQLRALHEKRKAEGKKQMEKNKEARMQKKGDRMQKMKEREAEMKAILTPQQFEKWQAQKQVKRQQMKEKMDKKGFKEMDRQKMEKK
ncbi:MAG: hypothetical protein ITF99_07435 [Chryseobacterium sp.]|nr:hypothetical protein [Chryseobacterium sp.]